MPGPVGATSGKFIIAGAALLLHARIDGNDVRMAIMPGAPTSAMTPQLADRVRARSDRPDVAIHIRAESIRARIATEDASPAPDAQVRIGQDVLADNPIEFDFVHHEAMLLSRSEARRLERRSRPIPVRNEPDGTLSVDLAQNGQPAVSARLDLTIAAGVATPTPSAGSGVAIGGVAMPTVDVVPGARPVVGLYAFKHVRVIFDLGHNRIWVRS